MAREIIVDIDPHGNVLVEASGFVGTECQALTQAIEQALGETVKVEKKPEFHRAKAAPLARKS